MPRLAHIAAVVSLACCLAGRLNPGWSAEMTDDDAGLPQERTISVSLRPVGGAVMAESAAVHMPPLRSYAEAAGPRRQTEDWLNDAGFSLLEQRDAEGKRSYEVLSNDSATNWGKVQMHARIGRPYQSAGFDVRREFPALGVTIPLEPCTFELEGLNDHDLGWLLMARAGWSANERLQYGVAVPLALGQDPTFGVVFQVRMHFGD
jgi:hypothetical protein